MTKLEEKLIELGYEKDCIDYIQNKPVCATYIKYFEFCFIEAMVSIMIPMTSHKDEPYHLSVKYSQDGFAYQKVIDNLQQAFNEMQRDLEILKEIEK